MHAETFGLAVSYVDRYCALQPVAVKHYQLVGITALLIAAKMREIVPPRTAVLADLCMGACERTDIKVRRGPARHRRPARRRTKLLTQRWRRTAGGRGRACDAP